MALLDTDESRLQIRESNPGALEPKPALALFEVMVQRRTTQELHERQKDPAA